MEALAVIGTLLGVLVTAIGVRHMMKQSPPSVEPTSTPESQSERLPVVETAALKSDLTRIPNPAAKLVGRENYLTQLDKAYDDPAISVVSLIAPGGVGKSAITDEWLTRLAAGKYGGAEIVFGWSFYSQGSHETATSSTQFYDKALPFFGHAGELPKPDEAKASLLFQLMAAKKCLLVLDGVEPLQHRPEVQHGWVADVGLKLLLDYTGRNGLENGGLILVSSRQELIEMEKYEGRNYEEIDLEFLNDGEGAALLESLGVEKFQNELTETSKEYGGHALALVLLGKMLKRRFKGDIRQRDRIPAPFDEEDQGKHAKRVMKYYADAWEKDAPEQLFLRMLGLFDRPMGERERDALLESAPFAAPLKKLDEGAWNTLFTHLEEAGLLLETGDSPGKKQWDTHPLIRGYFGDSFKKEAEKGWKAAHKVLFEHFQKVPEKEQPDTLAELEPLYRAVIHGCLAEDYKEADKIYWDRILRGDKYYSIKQLGAYATGLTAISGFFPDGWECPVSTGLNEADRAWLLGQASFQLMSLGRMEEAIVPRRGHISISEKLEDWVNALAGAHNLVDLLVPTGQLAEAKEAARLGIEWADSKTHDLSEQMLSRVRFTQVEHCLGALEEAEATFREAEELQKKFQPNFPRLYALQGTLFSVFLLDKAKEKKDAEEVLERGRYALKISTDLEDLLSVALDCLTIGRALERLGRVEEAYLELDKAVAGMRKAGKVDFFPLVLLARAAFHRRQGEWPDARRDLDEAMEISIRCGLRLYEADGLLLEGNLNLDTLSGDGTVEKAREALDRAAVMIEEMEYGLRIAEVELLTARVVFQGEDKGAAVAHYEKAIARIEETGHFGLNGEAERVKGEIRV